jgi:hypothetical protein
MNYLILWARGWTMGCRFPFWRAIADEQCYFGTKIRCFSGYVFIPQRPVEQWKLSNEAVFDYFESYCCLLNK